MSTTPSVLFVCVHNAGRSQMAAAWFNQLVDPAKGRAISAGTGTATGTITLPGGHVVVTTGLLEMVERPEELLGVLAHDEADRRAEDDQAAREVAENGLSGEPDGPGQQQPGDHRDDQRDADPRPLEAVHGGRAHHRAP